jgi:8-amino-7-oxononanoate synthase
VSRYGRWQRRAEQIEQEGLRRTLRTLVPLGPTRARWPDGPAGAGFVYDVFSSNDYLGLAEHPEVKAAMASGGSGAARLISGNRRGHEDLEDALSAWLGRPATLFGSGYLANLAVYSALFDADDVVASDALNHASIIDGLRLSKARRTVLPHGADVVSAGTTAIAVEGLYSMDGDFPPLRSLSREPLLVVDEAHAVGCIGPQGRGYAASLGITPDIIVGTLGKAFGAAGAFVVGPPAVREILVSASRPFIYTTAMPEGVAAAARVGLDLATDALRGRLSAATQRLRNGLAELGIPALGSAHIVPILTGANTMNAARALLERGFLVGAVRYPTVARGQERLRITLSAEHDADQVDRLLAALSEVLQPERNSMAERRAGRAISS